MSSMNASSAAIHETAICCARQKCTERQCTKNGPLPLARPVGQAQGGSRNFALLCVFLSPAVRKKVMSADRWLKIQSSGVVYQYVGRAVLPIGPERRNVAW